MSKALDISRAAAKTELPVNVNKRSAVAETGDRARTNKVGRKWRGGAAVPLSVGELGPHLTQCRLG